MSRSSYLTGAGTRQTIQTEPIPGTSQVENYAGGYVWQLSPMDTLRRFLVLGTAGGTYYANERDLTREATGAVRAALDELGTAAVQEIVEVSEAGRAPKNDEAIYALAMAAGHSSQDVREAALAALPRVCRIGTHLFKFMNYVRLFRGHGRALNRALAEWYTEKEPERLAYQLVKYRQREGWTHADVLRKCKPRPERGGATDELLRWAVGKTPSNVPVSPAVDAYLQAQAAPSPRNTAELVRAHGGALPWEALQTEHTTDPQVIEALAPRMPLGALVRQLGRFSAHGALRPMSALVDTVADRVANPEEVRKARIHPIAVLAALITYSSGQGARGSLSWTPDQEIIGALDAAFYHAFGNVEPTGKRTLLGLDVSGSMDWGQISSVPGLTPRVGSAAMALVQASVGDPFTSMAFCHAFVPIAISPRQRLDDVVRAISGLPFGGTDCSLPMVYAQQHGLEVDTFVIYTDNETWAGAIHPAQALQQYRDRSGIPARLVVVGMTATKLSIANPNDPGMLDVVGFDTAAPNLIADFSAGRI